MLWNKCSPSNFENHSKNTPGASFFEAFLLWNKCSPSRYENHSRNTSGALSFEALLTFSRTRFPRHFLKKTLREISWLENVSGKGVRENVVGRRNSKTSFPSNAFGNMFLEAFSGKHAPINRTPFLENVSGKCVPENVFGKASQICSKNSLLKFGRCLKFVSKQTRCSNLEIVSSLFETNAAQIWKVS